MKEIKPDDGQLKFRIPAGEGVEKDGWTYFWWQRLQRRSDVAEAAPEAVELSDLVFLGENGFAELEERSRARTAEADRQIVAAVDALDLPEPEIVRREP